MNIKQIDFLAHDLNEVFKDEIKRLSPLKNKSVFITGASGFVGKWLIEAFNYLNQEHQFNVQIIANSRTIKEQSFHLPYLFNKKHVRQIPGDIKAVTHIDRDISFVVHLAGSPDNREHASDPVKVMNDIYMGTNKVLDACTRLDVLENIIHFSSGLVNGPQPLTLGHVQEDSFQGLNCASTNSVYAEAKRSAESLVQGYRSLYKLPVSILRPFAFIGPHQSIERPWAINNFIRDSLQGQPIRILGDENTVRSYMYPNEMALWALIALAEPRAGSIYNLGSADGITIRSIAQTVESSFDNRNGIVSNNGQQGLQTRFVPSTEKFETHFKVKRKLSTKEAIERSVQWYKLSL